jgi:O-antigen/teichoic acid export membrane protein
MKPLITRQRIKRLTSFASTQLVVQLIGFAAGILLVRYLAQSQYGYYTLAISMVSIAVILSDLGLATATMAIGGRVSAQRSALGHLVADANVMHRHLAWVSLIVVVPCFVVLLWRQQAAPWQVAALTVVMAATAALNVRAGIALSVARLLGHVGLQQKLDLGVNLGKLALLVAASWLTLDATVACLVNLAVAAAYFVVLTRHLDVHVELPAKATAVHTPALRQHLYRQAPNQVYFVLSSQLALWLIGFFGSADRVAEVGALSRLAALFTVIGAVSAALVLPYFARHEGHAELRAGFAGINVFYAALLALLCALAALFPGPILWVLGRNYGALQAELVWMIVASTLAAWGGTLYSIGCARGWVLPIGLTASTGLVATAMAASLVDVSTVRGSFMINTATGLTSMLVAFFYFSWQLKRHLRLTVAPT